MRTYESHGIKFTISDALTLDGNLKARLDQAAVNRIKWPVAVMTLPDGTFEHRTAPAEFIGSPGIAARRAIDIDGIAAEIISVGFNGAEPKPVITDEDTAIARDIILQTAYVGPASENGGRSGGLCIDFN